MSAIVLRVLDTSVRVVAPEPIVALFTDLFGDVIGPAAHDEPTEIVWSVEGDLWKVSVTGGSAVTDVAGGLADSIVSINRCAATSVAATHAVLHAGAFEVNGHAVAVTGVSGAGKSTLTAAAVLGGHGYLADEVTAVSADGMVRPYYRPIGLRAFGAASIGIEIPVNPLDAFSEVYPLRASEQGRLADAVPLRLVAFVHRRPGPVEIATVSAADALVRLTSLSLGTDGLERSMFRRLDRLVREVEVVIVSFEDSSAAVDVLAEFVR